MQPKTDTTTSKLASLDRERLGVAFHPLDLDPGLGGESPSGLEQLGRQIDPHDAPACLRGSDRGVAAAAGDIEYVLARPDADVADDPLADRPQLALGDRCVVACRPARAYASPSSRSSSLIATSVLRVVERECDGTSRWAPRHQAFAASFAGPAVGSAVAAELDRAHVRLAELVAALSLGIDLGFGQPMEHVLRQCLIALRLAERVGLDEDERAVVYYTALLVNVGCHTDAHEQAKWFGDDIALKADQVRARAREPAGGGRGDADARRRQPAAAPLPGRARVRGLRPPRARRHDRPPRRAGRALGRAARAARRGARGARRGVRAVGRPRLAGRARRATTCRSRPASRSWPSSSRWRTASAGSTAATELARKRARQAVRSRRSPSCSCASADKIFAGLDTIATWDAVIAAEPALAVVLSRRASSTPRCAAIANFVDLKSPYTLGHAPRRRRPRRRGRRAARAAGRRGARRCAAPGSCTASAVSACRTRSGTSAGRSAPASGSASACTRT